MKENLKEIKPGIGLGLLHFGFSQDAVRDLLGEPDEIELDEMEPVEIEIESGENQSITWHYDELDISLGFEKEYQWRLSTISVTDNFYQIAGEALVGMDEKSLMKKLSGLKIDDLVSIDQEDLEEQQELLISENSSLFFWLEEGHLLEIQFSPKFDENDHPIWP
jgi:hypothetical protein